jgi:hypothetical protein
MISRRPLRTDHSGSKPLPLKCAAHARKRRQERQDAHRFPRLAPEWRGAHLRSTAGTTLTISGREQVDVGVLDVHAPGTRADFDLPAFVAAARVAVDLREADDDASDSIGKSSKRESYATFESSRKASVTSTSHWGM